MTKAIDTNVLIRIVIQDDELQSKKALEYIKKYHPIFISHIVICEFSWVCISCYSLTKLELLEILEKILQIEEFEIENSEIVWSALHDYKNSSADYSDCLIASNAKHHSCNKVGTFDKKASSLSMFELIK